MGKPDKCAGCGARFQPTARGDGHHGFRHAPGCRWVHKSDRPGRRPGGQAIPLGGGA